MTRDEFIALAPRVSFGAGVLLWKAEVEIVPMKPSLGARVLVHKLVPDRVVREFDFSSCLPLTKGLTAITSEYLVSDLEFEAMDEPLALRRLLYFVRDSLFHEVLESIRIDGELALDPHRSALQPRVEIVDPPQLSPETQERLSQWLK